MPIRGTIRALLACCATGWTVRAAGFLVIASTGIAQSAPPAQPVVLDRVLAVVNNRAILWSDVTNEMRLSILEPAATDTTLDAHGALDRLISRALIQQQIRQEDAHAALPSSEAIAARIQDLRSQLPACVHMNCASDAGWNAFLAAHQLTAGEVENYIRMRLEVLGFIESRFRQGIRISDSEIEDYYRKTLLPQYPAGETPPALATVSPRIEEILLQQQVNALFGAWLENLRKQGDIEILDSTQEPATGLPTASSGGTP